MSRVSTKFPMWIYTPTHKFPLNDIYMYVFMQTLVSSEPDFNLQDMKTLSESTEWEVDPRAESTESGPGNVVVVDSAPGVDIITRVASIPIVSSTIGQVGVK